MFLVRRASENFLGLRRKFIGPLFSMNCMITKTRVALTVVLMGGGDSIQLFKELFSGHN